MAAFVIAFFGLTLLLILRLRQKPSLPLPPGPKGKPIIGNLGDLPPPDTPEYKHWLQLRDRYGPINSITTLGQTIIILHDARMAVDLLEKRSSVYSSRPRLVFAGEIIGWNDVLALQPYNGRFRAYRKALHQVLGTKALVSKFNPLQELEARRFLQRLLDDSENLVQHIRTEAGAIILQIAYGYTINPDGHDPLVKMANEAMESFSTAGSPGMWLVDTIPALKYLPSWFPFAKFQRLGRTWRTQLLTTVETPYQLVREKMANGTQTPSYLSSLLNKEKPLTEEEEFIAKWTSVALFTGGSDTSVSTLMTFFLAMALNPDVQTKAQEELDRVLGPYTLPCASDRPRLPYINAIVKESLRWCPVAPMGLPHLCTEEDEYEGYRIPKGAIVMQNIWSFTHNPTTYPEPDRFNPERFLGETPQADPAEVVFGFGRRICPGRVLADSSIFMTVAMVLAMMRISPEEGMGGKSGVELTPGVVSQPVLPRGGVRVVARSKQHEEVVRGDAR
ncbi:putative cytochrome P450 [Aspergillus sclerotioniger CBS 115572]|uniref:Putative cytochrome P450 n=1 Tax=Aspergillus sclerotioniger CBS 115572 TaxID=1450535 RepID=A0A317VCT5_9EURO|nr:putative cytochrome P450 [Aspergillus sclerotioniger CBS 115572]PWY71805.1 putative cytochrome P450 [Aspergillus sclerotioniger CBS 115572]